MMLFYAVKAVVLAKQRITIGSNIMVLYTLNAIAVYMYNK